MPSTTDVDKAGINWSRFIAKAILLFHTTPTLAVPLPVPVEGDVLGKYNSYSVGAYMQVHDTGQHHPSKHNRFVKTPDQLGRMSPQ